MADGQVSAPLPVGTSSALPTGAVNSANNVRPVDSPWADKVDFPDPQPKNRPKVIGSLDGSVATAPTAEEPTSLVVPLDMEEKVGQKIPAENYLPSPAQNEAPLGPSQGATSVSAPTGLVNSVIQNNQPATSAVTLPTASKVVETAVVPGPKTVDGIKPIEQTKPSSQPPEAVPVAPPPISSAPTETPTKVEFPVQTPPVPPPPPKPQSLIGNIRGKFKLGRGVGAIKDQAVPLTDENYVAGQLPKAPFEESSAISKLVSSASAIENKLPDKPSLFSSKPRLIGAVAIILLVIVTFLTEFGIFSVGFEKVYGAVGLERLWGGLSRQPLVALGQAMVASQAESDFKAEGTITLTVDKSTNSPIISPIAAEKRLILPRVASVWRAIKTATSTLPDELISDDIYDYGTNELEDEAEEDIYLDEETDEEELTEEEETESDASQDQYPSYQYQGASVKEITSSVDLFFSQGGGAGKITLKKVTGDEEIDLKNYADKLWVKSSNRIKFSANAEADKWLEYTLAPLKSRNLPRDFYKLDSENGFSVKGRRLSNEKVGKVRTYRYKIDSLEIGSSLANIGVTSDMVQNVSGDIWIGVKDKLIRRASLKITTSPSAPVTQVVVDLTFTDYGKKNTLVNPEVNQVIEPGNEAGATTSAIATTPAVTTPSTPVATPTLTGDAKRKDDLAKVKTALASYKAKLGSYPVASALIRLNAAGNSITQALVPTYLSAMPADDKVGEGWFYAYKSNGTTFTLSARLESTTDPTAKLVDGIYLYYVYND